MTREDRRQAIHAGTSLLALSLRFLSWNQALGMAITGVVIGWVVFPLTGLDRSLRRERAPWLDGLKLYPVAILALVLLFDNLSLVAAAWAVMGIGDATSNLIGRRFGRSGFVGRNDRSAVGSVAFVVTAVPAALGAYLFVESEPVKLALAATAAGVAALIGAIVELVVPPGFDDNLAIAIASGAAFSYALVALG